MKAEITDRPGGALDVEVEATPICGTDFCDRCGDCLACYAEFGCYGGRAGEPDPSGCRWVVYADLTPERAAQLLAEVPDATPR